MYTHDENTIQKFLDYKIVYGNNSVLIDKELDELFNLSNIYMRMFNIQKLENINSNIYNYIKHTKVCIIDETKTHQPNQV